MIVVILVRHIFFLASFGKLTYSEIGGYMYLAIINTISAIFLLIIAFISLENNYEIRTISENSELNRFWQSTYKAERDVSNDMSSFYKDKEKYIIYTRKLYNLDCDISPRTKKEFPQISKEYIAKINYYRDGMFRRYKDIKYVEYIYYISSKREVEDLGIKGWKFDNVSLKTKSYENAVNSINNYDNRLFKETKYLSGILKKINYCPHINGITKNEKRAIMKFDAGNEFQEKIMELIESHNTKFI